MQVNILTLKNPGYPQVLTTIDTPPAQLFYTGAAPEEWLGRPKVAIVGSRKASPYGRQITNRLAGELARVGVVIISGLAYGIDAEAHQAALGVGGCTVAVLPTSVEQIYPSSHRNLARQIIDSGGTLISEYASTLDTYKLNFIARNRIVSGLADVLLITEAAVNSGSLHTARFALEQGKTVMSVPGNITSPTSEGCNNLIKSGALPVTDVSDIFFALGLNPQKVAKRRAFNGTPQEKMLIELIGQGISDQEELAIAAKISGAELSSNLTMLEIGGHIRAYGSGNWTLA